MTQKLDLFRAPIAKVCTGMMEIRNPSIVIDFDSREIAGVSLSPRQVDLEDLRWLFALTQDDDLDSLVGRTVLVKASHLGHDFPFWKVAAVGDENGVRWIPR